MTSRTTPTEHPVALITGASSGIGRATALALAAQGFDVFGTSRRATAGEERDGITMLPLDVTDEQSVTDVVREVLDRRGRIDVLVNNAGYGIAGAAEESSLAQARQVFETNLFGLIAMTRAVLPTMRAQRGGRIINISSVVGAIPTPYMAIYAASKHAVEGYSQSLDHEVREFGIRSLLIAPAYTNTAFEDHLGAADAPLEPYAERMAAVRKGFGEAFSAGDDPAVVASAVVAAATTSKPRLRTPAGKRARQVLVARRLAPESAFDKQIRQLNGLPTVR